jgi:hypothetical protein
LGFFLPNFPFATSFFLAIVFFGHCAKKQHNTRGTPRFNMDCVKSLDWCMYNGKKKTKPNNTKPDEMNPLISIAQKFHVMYSCGGKNWTRNFMKPNNPLISIAQ